jgi:hypothetical protein
LTDRPTPIDVPPEVPLNADEIAAALGAVTPRKEPFDPEPGRERLRGWIVVALVGVLSLVVALSFLLFWLSPRPAGELRDLLLVLVPPVTSLVSAVVGFYYGSSTRGRD